jgi:hypothetical protein
MKFFIVSSILIGTSLILAQEETSETTFWRKTLSDKIPVVDKHTLDTMLNHFDKELKHSNTPFPMWAIDDVLSYDSQLNTQRASQERWKAYFPGLVPTVALLLVSYFMLGIAKNVPAMAGIGYSLTGLLMAYSQNTIFNNEGQASRHTVIQHVLKVMQNNTHCSI